MRLAAAIEYIPEATGPPPPRSMVSRRCSTFPRTSLRPLLGARRSSRPGERIAVAAAWDARRGEVKTGLPDGRPQAEIQLTTGEKTACRAFSRSGRPIPLAAAPVGPYRQDGDGNYVATFAGASPESRALGRHFRRAQPPLSLLGTPCTRQGNFRQHPRIWPDPSRFCAAAGHFRCGVEFCHGLLA